MPLDNAITQAVLPLAIVALMFGLGTTLTAQDLARV